MNQLVAIRMLKALGVVCDVADDGVEAVEACKKCLYDIVLMVRRHPSILGWGWCKNPVDVGYWNRKNKVWVCNLEAEYLGMCAAPRFSYHGYM